MSERLSNQTEFERQLQDRLVTQYFQHDSVNEVMRLNPNSGISYAYLQRELDRRGIIKKPGVRGKSLPYALFFFAQMVLNKLPLERLYKEYMPPSFRERMSIVTLHRIYENLVEEQTKEEDVRRYGTVLVITPEDRDDLVMVGKDVSPPSDKYGKRFGATTLPIGFSTKYKPRLGALRVFQQEVATQWAIDSRLGPNGDIATEVLPPHQRPFGIINIVDVRVRAFHIRLPRDYCSLNNFSSFKLRDYQWMPVSKLSCTDPDNPGLRAGIVDVVSTYENSLERETFTLPITQTSFLNRQLAALASA